MKTRNYAFIDGSYNPDTHTYGCGGFVIDQYRHKHTFKKCGKVVEMCLMRNVAGEILGVIEAIKLAKKLKMKEITIYHDYIGLSKWITGEWRPKKRSTKKYAKFVLDALESGMSIYFKKVKGHSGIKYNDEADRLAKESVGLL